MNGECVAFPPLLSFQSSGQKTNRWQPGTDSTSLLDCVGAKCNILPWLDRKGTGSAMDPTNRKANTNETATSINRNWHNRLPYHLGQVNWVVVQVEPALWLFCWEGGFQYKLSHNIKLCGSFIMFKRKVASSNPRADKVQICHSAPEQAVNPLFLGHHWK